MALFSFSIELGPCVHGGASAFLLQAWQELFDPFTPDSYQPRLHHTASLVEELENIAGWAETDGRWETHVALIKAELRHVAGAETVFLDGLPRYNWSISQLLKLTKPRDPRSAFIAMGKFKAKSLGPGNRRD